VLSLYVGSGITQKSDPEKEWKEILKKSETMLNALF
jgi:isochorismate synthase EntC